MSNPRDDERRKFEAWRDATWGKALTLHGSYEMSLWECWLARAEQAETPQTRKELEKEWLTQTKWQDFTNWLIHVKLREKLTDKCTCDSIVGPHCTYAGHKIT